MKVLHKLFLAIFLLFLAVPALQHFTRFARVEPVNEHREKEPWPAGRMLSAIAFDKSYASRVEKYFSDWFPLRDLLLRVQGQFEYSALGVAREAVVGRDGWLADRKLIAEHLPQLDRADEEQIRSGVLQLKRLQHWLAQRDVRFLLVIVPVKPSVYEDEFPQKFRRRVARTGLERFQEALALNDVPFLDVRSDFLKARTSETLYFKTDMHWNTVGVSRVAKAIVDRLSMELRGKPLWAEELTRGQRPFEGEELKSIPLLFPRPEQAPLLSSARPAYVQVPTGRPDLEVYRGTDPARALLPPTIMFGNSFMLEYPTVGYHNYFSESSRVLDYQFFKHALDAVQPQHRVFILHVYETQLQYHLMPTGRAGAWSGFADYWDPRVKDLPLPPGFTYRAASP